MPWKQYSFFTVERMSQELIPLNHLNSYGNQCLHDEICGSWKVFKLHKQNVVQSQSNLEDSLDVSPIYSNSKAQTNSFTNQKYIVNSCVIVKYGEIFYPGVVIEVLDDQRRNNFLKRHRNKKYICISRSVGHT
ncbi:hypothetical protein BgiBS90_037538, partial [Biomphalaria glabrata]